MAFVRFGRLRRTLRRCAVFGGYSLSLHLRGKSIVFPAHGINRVRIRRSSPLHTEFPFLLRGQFRDTWSRYRYRLFSTVIGISVGKHETYGIRSRAIRLPPDADTAGY